MDIGILGSGPKGRLLAAAWSGDRHRVKVGDMSDGSASAAAAFGELVLIDLPWRESLRELQQLRDALANKIIVDCVNPADESGMPAAGLDRSFAEMLAAMLPGSKVVKALNTIVPETLEYVLKQRRPAVDGQLLTILYCGDDEEAKLLAAGLIGELDFETIDAGNLKYAALLEPAGILVEQLHRSGHAGRYVALNVVHETIHHSPLDTILTD